MRTGFWQTDNPDYGKSSQNPAYWERRRPRRLANGMPTRKPERHIVVTSFAGRRGRRRSQLMRKPERHLVVTSFASRRGRRRSRDLPPQFHADAEQARRRGLAGDGEAYAGVIGAKQRVVVIE